MTKTLLPLFIVLSLTACHERRGPEPETSKFTEQLFTTSPTHTVTENVPLKEKGTIESDKTEIVENEKFIKDIPILENNVPVLVTPIVIETESNKYLKVEK